LMAMPLTCSPARIRASKRWRVIVDTDGFCLLHCDRHTAHGGRNFSADPRTTEL
jgi:hypothetical protein